MVQVTFEDVRCRQSKGREGRERVKDVGAVTGNPRTEHTNGWGGSQGVPGGWEEGGKIARFVWRVRRQSL